MGFYPTNPLLGQTVQSEAADLSHDKGFIAHLVFTATQAIAASTTGILAAFATSTLATEKTTGFTQPTCAKNVTATAGGTAGDIKAVQVVVEGFDIAGNAISETLPAFTVDTAGSVAGSKAFKTITKVTVPGMMVLVQLLRLALVKSLVFLTSFQQIPVCLVQRVQQKKQLLRLLQLVLLF